VRQQRLPVHSVVAEHEPGLVNQAWELVLQQPADLVHLSKPRLPAVAFGLLYKLLWGAAARRFDGIFGVSPFAASRR
jgi:hypothetical protein